MGNIFDINTLLKENVLSDELLAKPYSKETFMFSAIESLKKFNENSDLFTKDLYKGISEASSKDQINKAFDPLVRVRSKGIIGADDMAMVFGVGVLITIAVNILPILRELTYFFYDIRTRVSQYFDLQSDLLEMNAADIEKNNSVTIGDRNKVVARQRKIAEFFRKIANTFAIEQKEREVYAAKEIERQNKKLKYDEIEDKTRGNGTVPNGKQTTPTTNDSIF